jgi:sporulation protein YlmC with PRC-barrel domain
MDHPKPWLRYVDAKDLEDKDKTLKFSGMEVDDPAGEKLGKVEGFIIDISSGRPFHVVVNAGHWFKHKHVLLPVGHVMLDATGQKMIAGVSKERVSRFPGFDKDKFEKLSKDELRDLARTMALECGCPDEAFVALEWETWDDYAYPSWWEASFYRPERIENQDELGITHPQGRSAAADRTR